MQAALLAGYPEQVARMTWDRARIVAHQRAELRELLAHASEHSPFHARRLAGIELAAIEPGDLSSLPVMSKSDLMSEFDDVLTDRRLTRELVEASLAATSSEPAPLFGEYLAFNSGGSSGTRGVFVYDRRGLSQFIGSLTRGLVARIQASGGPPPGGLPIAIVAASSAAHLTGLAAPCTVGGTLPYHYFPVPVTQPVPQIVERLNALQPAMLYGYPSMLARLAREQRAGRLAITPAAVSCTSETLSPDLRSAIRAGFGVPIVDGFASTEGLVGSSRPDDDVMVFAEDGTIIELVDHEYRPVQPGTPAATALITQLSNRVQPLIRYELTDVFVQEPYAAEHGHLRVKLQGRGDATFHYRDVTIHPFVICSALLQIPDILETQVCQTTRGVTVHAVANPTVDRTAATRLLADALTAAGLDRPEVTINVVPELPRDPRTGKLRQFVPYPTNG